MASNDHLMWHNLLTINFLKLISHVKVTRGKAMKVPVNCDHHTVELFYLSFWIRS